MDVDLREATAGDSTDLYYLDMELYDTPEYGAAYILDAERPAVIETGLGTNTDRILAALEELGIAPGELAAIAVTHVHLDHAGGAGFLAAACPNADVVVPDPGAQFLVDPEPLWEGTKAVIDERIGHYVEPRPVPAERVVGLADGETVELGDHALTAHAAPGHAFHQAVLYDPANDGAFTGDAAGIEPDGQLAAYADVLESWVDSVARVRAREDDDAAVAEYFAERADTVDAWGPVHARDEERLNVAGVLEYLDG
ncbi:MBL fold metallo-hydrolase [Halobacteriales archaeon QH_10_67_13]|nr:MAG: MBL fold metallo-hydrolase [Halobacteriales archaeon QH_10_67_13]